MARLTGFEPETYGLEVTRPRPSQHPILHQLIKNIEDTDYQILVNFLCFGQLWNKIHTQIHTRKGRGGRMRDLAIMSPPSYFSSCEIILAFFFGTIFAV